MWAETRREHAGWYKKYSMRDLISDVIGHCARRFNAVEMSANDKISLGNLEKGKRRGAKNFVHEIQSRVDLIECWRKKQAQAWITLMRRRTVVDITKLGRA